MSAELRSVVSHAPQDPEQPAARRPPISRSVGSGGSSGTIRVLLQCVVLMFLFSCCAYANWMVELRAEQRLEELKSSAVAPLANEIKELKDRVEGLKGDLADEKRLRHSLSEELKTVAQSGTEEKKDKETVLGKKVQRLVTKIEDLEDIIGEKAEAQEKVLEPLKKKLDALVLLDPHTKFEQIEASLRELRSSGGGGNGGGTSPYQPQVQVPGIDQPISKQESIWVRQQRAMQEEQQKRLNQDHVRQANQRQDIEDRNARERQQREALLAAGRQREQAHQVGNAPLVIKPKVADETEDEEEGPMRTDHRRVAVRKAFIDGWGTYKKHAWGHDEVKPVTQKAFDWTFRSHGLGLTIVDSLDTLILMNLTSEFDDALDWVEHKFNINQHIRVSAFEMTIRVVGGLLSAYELSGEKHDFLLETATKVMNKLLYTYNTSSGIPHQTVDLKDNTHWSPEWTGKAAVLSEYGSVQLELRTLSYHTEDPIYDMKGTHLMSILASKCEKDNYLCPTYIDINQVSFRDDHLTMGALGDSYYEYLVKQFLLTGKTEQRYHDMALKALEAGIDKLVKYSSPSRLTYLSDFVNGGTDNKMDELACFAGGMYALASVEIEDSGLAKTFMTVAKGLAKTCYNMFTASNTGLAAESVDFRAGMDFHNGPEFYLLRPETSETLFYMWRITGDDMYREWQWEIFTHLREHCHVSTGGFSGIRGVNIVPPELDDQQQSFLLAETFKYMYLTFAENELVNLKEWVFNTEAHPLKIRKRDPMKIWREWEDDHHGLLPWYPPTCPGVREIMTAKGRLYMQSQGQIRAPVDAHAIEEPQNDDDSAREAAQRQEQDETIRAKQMAQTKLRAEVIAKENAAMRMRAAILADQERLRGNRNQAVADNPEGEEDNAGDEEHRRHGRNRHQSPPDQEAGEEQETPAPEHRKKKKRRHHHEEEDGQEVGEKQTPDSPPAPDEVKEEG